MLNCQHNKLIEICSLTWTVDPPLDLEGIPDSCCFCITSKLLCYYLCKYHSINVFQRNPKIKLYGLPWDFPGWIGKGSQNPYSDVHVLADYIYRWINGAKVHHNLTIDYIGVRSSGNISNF